MTLSLLIATKNELLEHYRVKFDAGSLNIYSGVVPTNADAALSGNTLLGTLTFSATAFPTPVTGGSMTANPITEDSSANATGDASFYRASSSGGTIVEQGSCGAAGSGAECILNTVSIVAGGPIQCTSFIRTL